MDKRELCLKFCPRILDLARMQANSESFEQFLMENLYFCPRPKTQKQYSRDVFVSVFALLVIVAFVYTIRKTPEKLVNRDQTEEWKGWMQVSESSVWSV